MLIAALWLLGSILRTIFSIVIIQVACHSIWSLTLWSPVMFVVISLPFLLCSLKFKQILLRLMNLQKRALVGWLDWWWLFNFEYFLYGLLFLLFNLLIFLLLLLRSIVQFWRYFEFFLRSILNIYLLLSQLTFVDPKNFGLFWAAS